MENQDKIYSQFKNAAEKSEAKDFPNMDKIWNRVEEKLDQKVLKKETKLWKKIAVAASVLLVISVLYQFLKSEVTTIVPTNEVVIQDSISTSKKVENTPQTTVADADLDTSYFIRKDAAKILKEQIAKQADVVTNYKSKEVISEPNSVSKWAETAVQEDRNDDAKSGGIEFKGRKFDAIGVVHETRKEQAAEAETVKKAIQIAAKSEPLLIINNKAVTSNDASTYDKVSKKEMAKINSEDLETVVYLKEPLYIIDGKQYSEEELFGAKPTSPYAPLSEQEIINTEVLQGKEAVKAYGEKGTKGVLIITTKNGKPAVKKAAKKP